MKTKFALLIIANALIIGLGVALWGNTTYAQDDNKPTPTPSGYVDLLDTEIRGLSPEQIEGYRTGAGLGMALPAELNGYPGPRHVLDLADELELTDAQYSEIQALYDAMLPVAIRLGEEILVMETELEEAFRTATIDEAFLQDQLTELSVLYSDLRFTHLRTHLATINILTPYQVDLYITLRGYMDTNMDEDVHLGHNG